ncbi:MAG: hypothetical protein D8M59_07555 [Planctomycetes bacterium]|nr:hypothetical protein [Planctomycetota bacterium]
MVGAPRLEDRLGPDEPPYRSRGEAQIGRLLDRYSIPFYHEQPRILLVNGTYRCWKPDFTLPEYNSMVIEYAGMPDVPDYMRSIRIKESAYRDNGIPALFLYPDDLTGRDWEGRVMERVLQSVPYPHHDYTL